MSEGYVPLTDKEVVSLIASKQMGRWAIGLEKEYPEKVTVDEAKDVDINVSLKLGCPREVCVVNDTWSMGIGVVVTDKSIKLGYAKFMGYSIPRLAKFALPDRIQETVVNLHSTSRHAIVKTGAHFYVNKILVLELGLQEWVVNPEDLSKDIHFVEITEGAWKEMIARYVRMK